MRYYTSKRSIYSAVTTIMPNVLIVERLGSIKSTNMKTVNEDEFYKKAGFKTPTDFQVHHVFKVKVGKEDPYNIHLYGKIRGKANQENKYDFPPPVDNTLFFGNCLLVNKNDQGDVLDLSVGLWEKIYEKLFGGFEDLTGDDSEDDIDTEEQRILNDPTTQFTKEGYVKDDFIVDDASDELLDDADDSDEVDDSDEDNLVDQDSEGDLPVSSASNARPRHSNPGPPLVERSSWSTLPTKKPTKNTKTSLSIAKSSSMKVKAPKEPIAPKPTKVRATTTKDKKPSKSKRAIEDVNSDAPSALICKDELTEEEYFK